MSDPMPMRGTITTSQAVIWRFDSEGVDICDDCASANPEFADWPGFEIDLNEDDADQPYCEACERAPSGRRSPRLEPLSLRERFKRWITNDWRAR